jgi:LCP family protein required for cell wall assembly
MSDMTDTTSQAGVEPSAGNDRLSGVEPSGRDDRPSASHHGGRRPTPHRRKRRPWRIALVALGSFLGLVLVVAAGGYAYVNHLVSSIPRVKVAYLTAATSGSGQTFLFTANPYGPTGRNGQPTSSPTYSELFMLMHINANGKAGGAVAIPGNTVVNVPGHGSHQLYYALKTGGPSLAVETITKLTGVPINHYARIDFNHVAGLLNAIGGVQVTIPKATSAFGQTFHAGVNQLTGVTAVYYARDPSLSQVARTLRQEVLVRDTLAKIGNEHLLTNPVTMVNVLKALTSALTVDSNMTNSEVVSLAHQLGGLGGSAATFLIAATQKVHGTLVLNTAIDNQLWTAIEHDNIAGFAAQNPSTVTPQAVP